MGAGASAGSAVLKSKVVVTEGGDCRIPLKHLAPHLRVYQHCNTGEVLVLVDHLISDVGYLVDRPSDWFQVSVCKKEAKYLETLRVDTTLNEHSKEPSALSSKSHEATQIASIQRSSFRRQDSDRSLLDPLQHPPGIGTVGSNIGTIGTNNPDLESSSSRKNSDVALRTNDVPRMNSLESDPFRKSKLPPIIHAPQIAGFPPTPAVRTAATPARLLVFDAMSDTDKSSPLSPFSHDVLQSPRDVPENLGNVPDIARDLDAEFSSPGNRRVSPNSVLKNTSKKGRFFRNVLPTESSPSQNNTMTLDIDSEFDELGGGGGGRDRGGHCGSSSGGSDDDESRSEAAATLARLVRENLLYNSESRTYCCQICGEVSDDSYPIEQVCPLSVCGRV